ncbi:MAG: hypothetical protein PUC30_06125 [Lachnospiraceae bacterium]|nr:hypothetical protein [Lachnospiraceae bacterium]
MRNGKRKVEMGTRFALIIVLIAAIFVYRFVYYRMVEERDAIYEESKVLENRLEELDAKETNRGVYIQRMQTAEDELRKILGKYGAGNTPEKSILFIKELEDSLEVKIPNVSFSEPSELISVDLSGIGETQSFGQIIFTKENISFGYSCDYETWKKLLTYIGEYPERRTVQSVTASYNSASGTLDGTMVLNLFAVTGGEKEYIAPVTEDVPLGRDNLFAE